MKPVTKKTVLSTAILTAAFSLVLIVAPALGSGDSLKQRGGVGLAMIASAVIWATGSADSDDHHRKH